MLVPSLGFAKVDKSPDFYVILNNCIKTVTPMVVGVESKTSRGDLKKFICNNYSNLIMCNIADGDIFLEKMYVPKKGEENSEEQLHFGD